eukprot:5290353-Pyramimonas_sp.AAC.1
MAPARSIPSPLQGGGSMADLSSKACPIAPLNRKHPGANKGGKCNTRIPSTSAQSSRKFAGFTGVAMDMPPMRSRLLLDMDVYGELFYDDT